MADPALIKIAVEAAIQVAKDEESRKRLLAIILAPTIFLLILIAFILYLVTSPLSMLTGWLVGDEISVVEEFQRDYGFNQSIGIYDADYVAGSGQSYEGVTLGSEGETQVVYFSQFDERWRDQNYGPDKIGTHGCGPTSMSIVVSISYAGQGKSQYYGRKSISRRSHGRLSKPYRDQQTGQKESWDRSGLCAAYCKKI